jgi:hypothetical protein
MDGRDGWRSWIEGVGPRFTFGRLHLPRSALLLPFRIILIRVPFLRKGRGGNGSSQKARSIPTLGYRRQKSRAPWTDYLGEVVFSRNARLFLLMFCHILSVDEVLV